MDKPILIVIDDDPIIGKFVKIVGNLVGYDVKLSTNYKEFQRLITAHEASAIVLDIVMPDMSGLELLDWPDTGSDRQRRHYCRQAQDHHLLRLSTGSRLRFQLPRTMKFKVSCNPDMGTAEHSLTSPRQPLSPGPS